MSDIQPPPLTAPMWLRQEDSGKITNPVWVLWLQSLGGRDTTIASVQSTATGAATVANSAHSTATGAVTTANQANSTAQTADQKATEALNAVNDNPATIDDPVTTTGLTLKTTQYVVLDYADGTTVKLAVVN